MDSRSDAATQDLLRQLQQAIQLGGLTRVSQQPPALPVPVMVQQRQSSSGNVGLTPVTQAVVQINSGAETNTSTPVYSYKVKIINPNKKSDVIVRQLNRFSSKFESVTDIRRKFVDEFGEHVPNTRDFAVGYFDGSQQAKTWLVTSDDLQTMYKKHSKGGNISLWCDGRPSADVEGTWAQKRKQYSDLSSTGTSRQEKEEVDSVYKELHDRHRNKYDTPRLRLWSRMITSGLHDDYDKPPDIPAFTGGTPK